MQELRETYGLVPLGGTEPGKVVPEFPELSPLLWEPAAVSLVILPYLNTSGDRYFIFGTIPNPTSEAAVIIVLSI